MIKTHQGYQSLNIREIPSFQQHEANQRQISSTDYKADWDDEKDAIFFPAHATESYEQAQKSQNAISDSKYKQMEKQVKNSFNMAESDHYKDRGYDLLCFGNLETFIF